MQSETLELDKTNVVRAGAGAGKTRNLSLRVLDWVEEYIRKHDQFPKLVVTTFTVKATQELKERLLLFASERENPRLLEFVRSGAYLHISTIHGVLSSLLRKYGHAIGLDAGFEVISSVEESKISKSQLRLLVQKHPKFKTLLEVFTYPEICGFYGHYYQNYLLGKTQKPLGKKQVEDFLLNELSRFRDQAKVLSDDINGELSNIGIESKSSANFSNLAGIFGQLLPQESLSLEDHLIDLGESIQSLGRFPTNPTKNPVIYPETKDRAKLLWDELKSFLDQGLEYAAHLEDFEKYNVLFSNLAELWVVESIANKVRSSKISMSDMELLSSHLIRQNPKLSLAFSEEFDYWLIDEFQDTSPEQLGILRKLIDDKPYYIVGDPQQSIYFFRGADQGLFLKEEDKILEDGGGRLVLMKNYRTKPSTMAFINDFMRQYGFETMETRDNSKLSPNESSAEFLISKTKESELNLVANRIVGLLSEGVAPSDICILSRTKKNLGELSHLLREKACPYYLHSSGSFYEKREILDLLFILKFLVHPYDRVNLVGLLRTPWFYVSDEQIFSIPKDEPDLWKALALHLKDSPQVKALIELRAYADEYGLISALEKAIVQSGMIELSRKYDPSGKREANIWKFLCQLRMEEIQVFFSPLKVLRKAEELGLSASEGELEAAAALEPNRVQLMTIHSSKGLEFPHVFVIGMGRASSLSKSLSYYQEGELFSIAVALGEEGVKKLPPQAKNVLDAIKIKELEESFRLMYVALTRAEEKLYLNFSVDIKKASWLENLVWDIGEGEHQKEDYKYQVINELEEVVYQPTTNETEPLRAPWSIDLETVFKPLETDSVSRLLEQRTEYGRQSKKGEENEFYSADHFKGRMDKAARGTSLHLVLEQYAASRRIGKDYEPPEALSFATEYIEYLLGESKFPFSELLESCHLEWGFVMRHHSKSIEGQVDFWGEDLDGQIWVIDYKTGSSHFKDKAMDQLKIYGLALSKLYKDRQIHLVTSFVEEKKSYVEDFDPEDSFFDVWQ